jgi:hypothetical protein
MPWMQQSNFLGPDETAYCVSAFHAAHQILKEQKEPACLSVCGRDGYEPTINNQRRVVPVIMAARTGCVNMLVDE